MPVYRLDEGLWFPPVDLAEEGIVAVGGDLSADRLLLAYRSGIFPWYNEDDPIIWWSPDPRFVLFPDELKVSDSMKQLLKREAFMVTYNQHFDEVIYACATAKRKEQPGTWIHPEMIEGYMELHRLGSAISVEVWQAKKLVGGLYGVKCGKVFCGESMFSHVSNASKYGFIHLVEKLQKEGFELIDSQLHTPHLESLGAKYLSRVDYIEILSRGL